MKCDVTVIVQKKVSMLEKWQPDSERGTHFVSSTLLSLFRLTTKPHEITVHAITQTYF